MELLDIDQADYDASYVSHSHGTTGEIVLPCDSSGKFPSIAINGRPSPRDPQFRGEGVVLNGDGGSHTIVVR